METRKLDKGCSGAPEVVPGPNGQPDDSTRMLQRRTKASRRTVSDADQGKVSSNPARASYQTADVVWAAILGGVLGVLVVIGVYPSLHNIPTPPPDTLHQRVIDRCVTCHIQEGVIR